MIYVLIIIALAGTDGGRAINTSLTYSSRESCESAKEAFNSVKWGSMWTPVAACIQAEKVR